MSKELFKNNESIEMYLETIYRLAQDNPTVKMSEVALQLGVTKPSCHVAMNQLKEHGYINQERYGGIELTAEGKRFGEKIFKRHQLLTQYLRETLDISLDLAEHDACRIEHVLSEETLVAIAKKLNFDY